MPRTRGDEPYTRHGMGTCPALAGVTPVSRIVAGFAPHPRSMGSPRPVTVGGFSSFSDGNRNPECVDGDAERVSESVGGVQAHPCRITESGLPVVEALNADPALVR